MSLSRKLAIAEIAWKSRRLLLRTAKSLTPSSSFYGEDLVIERLLHPGTSGIYVDVGANHPYMGSNTYRFYVKGWTGLAIDPNPKFRKDFKKLRPKDKHLTSGVSKTRGSLTYFEYESDNLNTLSQERADELAQEGLKPTRTIQVPCEPLSTIVERELGNTPIDLLNVDVEGMDQEVIESLDLRKHRPTVLIAEDFGRYISFLHARGENTFEQYLRANGYMPIAQMAWSAIFIAEDWRTLFARSRAFDESRTQNGYLPGQFETLPWAGKVM